MPLKIAAQYRIPLKWGSSSGCPARSVTLENSKIRNLKKPVLCISIPILNQVKKEVYRQRAPMSRLS